MASEGLAGTQLAMPRVDVHTHTLFTHAHTVHTHTLFTHERERERERERETARRRRYQLPLPSIVMGHVQSIRNKTDELEACTRYMHEFREANVICLSETWLSGIDPEPYFLGLVLYDKIVRLQLRTNQKEAEFVCSLMTNGAQMWLRRNNIVVRILNFCLWPFVPSPLVGSCGRRN